MKLRFANRTGSTVARQWCRPLVNAAFAAVLLAGPAGAEAGTVLVDVSQAGDVLTVTAADASVAQVLDALAEAKLFPIERVSSETDGEPVSGHFCGPVRAVLEQVLARQNHLVYTNVRTRAVERLVVLGRPVEASAAVAPAPIAVGVAAQTVATAPDGPVEIVACARPPTDRIDADEQGPRRRTASAAVGHVGAGRHRGGW